ncbi:sugar kinase [Oxynema sp. CENA135]|uniref:sugar kinase n=1 Tax=Oxynema sp. CENA135 TaxID=984206 RepID=UPI00190E273E|nr:sugar kinase [Oxynema sp. CENA135]MBK4730439.1 sugar kinase [Oxynema sp. CENA135]
MQYQGLFVGLTTIDLLYLTPRYPSRNQKVVASESTIAPGGPVTNAAIAFTRLGDRAKLLSVVGKHPITALIRADLERYGVDLHDLDGDRTESPPVSSIVVTEATGDRAVISINATKTTIASDRVSEADLDKINLLAIDGHQMALSAKLAAIANPKNIPVAIDGGSWKPGFENVLPHVNYAICSANFFPPDCSTHEQVFEYLSSFKIPHIAITHGGKAIQYLSEGKRGLIPVPTVDAINTLGAGDIFHGAFYFFILREQFIEALTSAAQIAAQACRFFGEDRIDRAIAAYRQWGT